MLIRYWIHQITVTALEIFLHWNQGHSSAATWGNWVTTFLSSSLNPAADNIFYVAG